MAKTKETQPQLPFKLEGNIALRVDVRTVTENQDGYCKIDFGVIRIRPLFNPRQKPSSMSEDEWDLKLEIAELADGIFESCGPADPIIGDFYKEDLCFYITEGERRFRALRHLIATGRDIYPNGKSVASVKVLLNNKHMTDVERKHLALISQNKMKLTAMQRARYYKSFIDDDGLTHEVLAIKLNISRQTVDNYILANELSEIDQDKLNTGELTISAAVAQIRASKPNKKGGKGIVDLDSGEILTSFQEDKIKEEEKEKEKVRGDEDEFEQQDNSITFSGSRSGAKEEGSGAHVVGKDAIYMDTIKLAAWKQLVHRYEKVKTDILNAATLENNWINTWEDELAGRLKNEYNLTVK